MFLFLLAVACTEEKQIIENYQLSAEVLDFEEVALGTWESIRFSLTNTGNSDVELRSVSLVDVSANVWDLTWAEVPGLSPGGLTEFEVRFTPLTPLEEYQARIQIRTSMESTPILYVELLGAGGLSVIDGDGDGYSPADGDCDDGRANVFPGAEELCDGQDSDCDNILPDEEDDIDGDGWMICEGDCNDLDQAIYPGADEICDGKDTDCDGLIEDPNGYAEDLDSDGDGQTSCGGDCDDFNPDRFLGNTEICDFIDNNCTGYIDDGVLDADGDGHSACPSGGDCNDSDPLAYPVVFDSSAAPEGDGSVQNPFNTFNAALEGLDDVCRTVMVVPGSHRIGAGWQGGLVRVLGAGQTPEEVSLKAWEVDPERMIRVYSGSSVELENLSLYGAQYQYTGGAIFASGGDVVMNDVVVIDNHSNAEGGAIHVRNGTLESTNCEFSYNSSGGIGGAISLENASMVDSGSIFISNDALQGGGLVLTDSSAILQDVYFKGNSATDEGGAIAVYGNSYLEIKRARVWNNQALGYGGGFLFRNLGTTPFVLSNIRFQSNVAGVSGGGIAMVGNQVAGVVANNSFAENQAIQQGGDVYAAPDDSGDGIWLWGNLFGYDSSESTVYVAESANGSVAFNTCFQPSTQCFTIPTEANVGLNEEQDMLYTDITLDGTPNNDDLSLLLPSPAINSGPIQGTGPGFYTNWTDVDGSRNDRGYTGGPEASN